MEIKTGLAPVFALAVSLLAVKPAMAQEAPRNEDPLAENCRTLETRGQALSCMRATEYIIKDYEARLGQAVDQLDAPDAFVGKVNSIVAQEPCFSFGMATDAMMLELPLHRNPNERLRRGRGLHNTASVYFNDGSACIGTFADLSEQHGMTEVAGDYRALAAGMQRVARILDPQ